MTTMTLMATAEASSSRFHPKHLFIKLKAGQSMVKSPLIKSSKKIIGQIYLVKTNKLEELEAELSLNESVEYAQKDFYAEKKLMPKLEVLDHASLAMKRFTEVNFGSFNDPDSSKLWAFNSTAGMSVTEAYDKLPSASAEEVIVAVVDTGGCGVPLLDIFLAVIKSTAMWFSSRLMLGCCFTLSDKVVCTAWPVVSAAWMMRLWLWPPSRVR